MPLHRWGAYRRKTLRMHGYLHSDERGVASVKPLH